MTTTSQEATVNSTDFDRIAALEADRNQWRDEALRLRALVAEHGIEGPDPERAWDEAEDFELRRTADAEEQRRAINEDYDARH